MWCINCQKPVLECECPEIVDNLDRLQELYEENLALAARQVVYERRIHHNTLEVEKNAT